MAGSALSLGDLNVLLVRHGESLNNPLMAKIFAPVVDEAPASLRRREAEARWLAERHSDPALTTRGVEEAEDLAKASAPMLLRSAGSRLIRVFVSPFMRTLQTAMPLAQALGSSCSVEVHPDLFEVGGVYIERHGQRDGPGECLGAKDIERLFPGFVTKRLPQSPGGWYRASWESDAAARQRAAQIARWLRSAELRKAADDERLQTTSTSWVVLVIHGHLIDLLLKALLGIVDDISVDQPNTNVLAERPVVFFTPNAATAHVSIRRDGGVAIHHVGRRAPSQSTLSKL
ncbi:katG1 [Symbiodinium natans]|uniref:KatG1 protein n=1 Tax=Symbiodinium natans TaxID=878477 RepID=A0A812HXU8_9DINO|nr:katG1 [Symbiodinium natans]